MNKNIKKSLIITTAATVGMGVVLPTVSVLAAPAVMNGWTYQNNTWYYYKNGVKVKNGWQKDSAGWCFLNAVDGSWVQEGWAKDSHGWGYIRNGYWVERATWAKDSKGWNYIGPDGYLVSSIAPRATSPIEDANAAVTKAEATELQTDIDAAQALVTSLNDAINEKVDFTTRIEKIKYYLNLGNRAANIINAGLVAKRGEWIYYSNLYDGKKLYCMKLDGSSKKKLSDDNAYSINIKDGWLYYTSSTTDTNILYKMKTDGTSKTKLIDNYNGLINVAGDWIYYVTESTRIDVNGDIFNLQSLWKMKTDGSSKTRLTCGAIDINIVGDWIYYLDVDDYNGFDFKGTYKVCKIKTDGTSRTELGAYANIINVSGDWIYCSDYEVDNKIFKIKTDGTSKTTICKGKVTYMNVAGGWIYHTYQSIDTSLYKIKTDGTSMTKLTNQAYQATSNLNVAGDWIYYKMENGDIMYKIKNDGTGKLEIK